jgi:hypothetical protein
MAAAAKPPVEPTVTTSSVAGSTWKPLKRSHFAAILSRSRSIPSNFE